LFASISFLHSWARSLTRGPPFSRFFFFFLMTTPFPRWIDCDPYYVSHRLSFLRAFFRFLRHCIRLSLVHVPFLCRILLFFFLAVSLFQPTGFQLLKGVTRFSYSIGRYFFGGPPFFIQPFKVSLSCWDLFSRSARSHCTGWSLFLHLRNPRP